MFKAEDYRYIAVEKHRVMPQRVNPLETRPTTASDRLKAFAAERGQVDENGSLDLSGLHMQQEALEYVINQHIVHDERDEPVIKERDWRLPIPGDPDRSLRTFGRSSQRGGHRIEKTSAIDLDVYDPDKKLLATLQFGNLDEFYKFVDSHGPEEERDAFEKSARKLNFHLPTYLRNREGNTPLPRGPLDLENLWWGNATGPKPPAEIDADYHMRINVPLHNKEYRFDDVLQHRKQMELTGELPGGSWFGLTIAFGAHRLQIVQDSMRDSSEPPDMKSDRIFKIAEYDEHGNEVKQNSERVYTFNDLQELINGSKFTDIYWEVPATPERREWAIYRKFGWLATPEFTTPAAEAAEKAAAALDLALLEEHINNETASIERNGLHAVGGRNPARGPKLSKERRTAIWLLSGINAETKKVVDPKKMRQLVKLSEHSEHHRHRLEALEHIIEEQGLIVVFNLSLQLQKTFATCAKRLRLPLNETILSDVSWVMETLANQYNADVRHGVDPKVHSPFGGALQAKYRQRDIGNLHLGTMTAATVIHSRNEMKEGIERANAKDARDAALDKAKPGDELKKVARMVKVHLVDPLFAVSLPDFMKDEALEILQRVIEKDPKLGPHDYIQLGELLHNTVDTEG